MADDSDPDGDALLITARTNGAHGTVTITGGAPGLPTTRPRAVRGTDGSPTR